MIFRKVYIELHICCSLQRTKNTLTTKPNKNPLTVDAQGLENCRKLRGQVSKYTQVLDIYQKLYGILVVTSHILLKNWLKIWKTKTKSKRTEQQRYKKCKSRNLYIQCSIIFRSMLSSVKLERLNKSSKYNITLWTWRPRKNKKHTETVFDLFWLSPNHSFLSRNIFVAVASSLLIPQIIKNTFFWWCYYFTVNFCLNILSADFLEAPRNPLYLLGN